MPQATDPLRRMMTPYEGESHSVVAFALCDDESRFIASGTDDGRADCKDLVFEIGSITKVFTAILLSVLVEEGRVDPDAPLSEMSDDLADVPPWITPQSLTSHTSGLPRIHVPVWKALIKPLPEDPYADFSRADLLNWFRARKIKAPGGRHKYRYSNLGVGLLGEAMALREGMAFADLLEERVIGPLGLKDTTCGPRDGQSARFVQPRTTKGATAVPWTFQAMAAAGCLRSTAADLARFSARVCRAVNAPDTLLDRAILRSGEPIIGLGPRGGMEPAAQCSGWLSMRLEKTAPRILHHDGGTAGSTSAIYICPEANQALGILSNNGVAANLWASARLAWSNPLRQAHGIFTGSA